MEFFYKITLSYDGSLYFGWQKNSVGPSIESCLEHALITILQEQITLQAASRTDAGVHAIDQVVKFSSKRSIDTSKTLISLNQLLPPSIRCLHLETTSQDFHPTLSSISKTYHYHVVTSRILSPFQRNFCWHFPYICDFTLMRRASNDLLGRHDFKAFTNTKKGPHKDTVRTIFSIEIIPTEDGFLIEITGDHFLYKMVRNIVGTLCYIGCGKIAPEAITTILQEKLRTQAGMTAPASGLFLKKINYSNSFEKETTST